MISSINWAENLNNAIDLIFYISKIQRLAAVEVSQYNLINIPEIFLLVENNLDKLKEISWNFLTEKPDDERLNKCHDIATSFLIGQLNLIQALKTQMELSYNFMQRTSTLRGDKSEKLEAIVIIEAEQNVKKRAMYAIQSEKEMPVALFHLFMKNNDLFQILKPYLSSLYGKIGLESDDGRFIVFPFD